MEKSLQSTVRFTKRAWKRDYRVRSGNCSVFLVVNILFSFYSFWSYLGESEACDIYKQTLFNKIFLKSIVRNAGGQKGLKNDRAQKTLLNAIFQLNQSIVCFWGSKWYNFIGLKHDFFYLLKQAYSGLWDFKTLLIIKKAYFWKALRGVLKSQSLKLAYILSFDVLFLSWIGPIFVG